MTSETLSFTAFTLDKLSEKIGSLAPDGQQERATAVARRFLTRDACDWFIGFDLHLKTEEGARHIRLWQSLRDDSIQYTEYDESSGVFVPYQLGDDEDRGFTDIKNEGTLHKVLQRIAHLLTSENVCFSKKLKDSRNLGPYLSSASITAAKPIPPETELPLDVEKYLEKNRDSHLEMAKKQNAPVVISRTRDQAPASMIFFPDGMTAVHLKSDPFAVSGTAKKKKDAILIDEEGGRRRVARLVAHVPDSWQRERALNEVSALQSVQKGANQEILYKWIEGKNKRGQKTFTLYVENFSGGSVWSYLLKKGRIEKSEKNTIATGLIKSLQEQHAMDLFNRDVKMANALYSPRSGKAVFGDLDLSIRTTDKLKKAEDIWKLALILYEILTGISPPILDASEFSGKEGSAGQFLPYLNLSDPTHKLLDDMLQFRPEKRPDMESVLKRWENIQKQ
jgi:hypothetical protein